MRARRLLLVLALPVALVVAVAALVLWPRGTDEITEQDALTAFRDGSTAAEPATDDRLPAPGVYTYRATGEEQVRLGPFPTERRPLPETITSVVTVAEECFTVTVNYFEQHTEDTTHCAVDGGLRLDGHTKHQRIGALSPTAAMTCDPAVLPIAPGRALPLTCGLTLDGGPASISASLEGEAVAGPATRVRVGDDEVDTRPVTIEYAVTGDLTGAWTETTWWSDDHLPVRVERSIELRGPATLTERSELELTSLVPAT